MLYENLVIIHERLEQDNEKHIIFFRSSENSAVCGW